MRPGTLAELLTGTAGRAGTWQAPDLTGVELIVQPHCHHHSVMGFSTDRATAHQHGRHPQGCLRLLRSGRQLRDGEGALRDVGGRRGERPAPRTASTRRSGSIVLADGFSCRTQIDQLAGLPTLTLAELLANHIASS